MQLSGPAQFAPVDVPAPGEDRLGPGEVLLRVLAGGICGSDRPKLRRPPRVTDADVYPRLPGYPLHELVGEVVASRDAAHRVGDRVVGWALNSDALAELVVTPGARLVRCDAQAPATEEVLIQSVACVLHATDRLAVEGASVAVLGLGPIGLTFAHVLARRGARRVIGVDPVDRRDVAGRFGLDEVHVATSTSWSEGLSAARPEVVIEAVGHQVATLNDALRAVAPRGTVLYFGIPDEPIYPIDMEALMRRHLTLIGGVTREHARALEAARDYLAEHPDLARHLITHRFDRESVQEAFARADLPAEGRLKVVLDLTADGSGGQAERTPRG